MGSEPFLLRPRVIAWLTLASLAVGGIALMGFPNVAYIGFGIAAFASAAGIALYWSDYKTVWRTRRLKKNTIAELSLPLMLVVAVAALSYSLWPHTDIAQNIAIEPSTTLDASDPFSQQFTVTNEGPADISDVLFSCAVTSINPPSLIPGSPRVVWEMWPFEQPSTLAAHQKTNANCDFVTRFGKELRGVNIDLIVNYKLKGNSEPLHADQKFSGTRDKSGDAFVWVYGSPDLGVFEGGHGRVLVLQPFGSSSFPQPTNLPAAHPQVPTQQ